MMNLDKSVDPLVIKALRLEEEIHQKFEEERASNIRCKQTSSNEITVYDDADPTWTISADSIDLMKLIEEHLK